MTIQEYIDKWKAERDSLDYAAIGGPRWFKFDEFIKDLEEIQKSVEELPTLEEEAKSHKELLESYKKVTGKDPEWKWVKDPLPPQPKKTVP